MRAMGRFSASSFVTIVLNVGWYAVAIFLGLAVCFLAASPLVDPPRVEVGLSIPVSFTVDVGTHRVTAASLGEDGHIQDIRGSLNFSPRNKLLVAWSMVVLIVLLALVLWVLSQLQAVFRTIRDGHPFVPANAARIRRIGWAVILGELARTAIVYSGNAYALAHFTADGLTFDTRPDFNVFAIISGLIILAIAEVFRAGTRLDEEQSLTV